MSGQDKSTPGSVWALYVVLIVLGLCGAVFYTMLGATRLQCGAWPQPRSLETVASFLRTAEPAALGDVEGCSASRAFAWGLVAAWVLVLLVAVAVIARAVTRRRQVRDHGKVTKDDLTPMHRRKAVKRARARQEKALRTLSEEPPEEDLVVRVGAIDGCELFAQHEDSMLVLAPPRAGKTMYVAVEMVLSAPGPAVVTGTKADILLLSAQRRAAFGSVRAFDLMDVAHWPDQVRWDPVAGCEDPEEAMRRGKAWAAGGATDGARGAQFFNERAGEVLGYYLHAAAVKAGGSLREVVRWGKNFEDEEPLLLLESSGAVRDAQWAGALRTLTQSGAGETVGSLAMTLAGLLSPLQSPRVLELLCPGPGDRLNVRDFLGGRNTLYLMSGSGESPLNPLITMLADSIVREAQKLSQERPGEVLWPPLRLVLDEAANVAPIPDLHSIMSDSGGRGITTIVFAQTFAQMESRWGQGNARAIRDSATLSLYLGGIKEQELLKHLSALGGTYDAPRESVSASKQGTSVTSSTETLPRFDAEKIGKMTIPDDVGGKYAEAYLVYRNLQPAIIRLRPWWKRPDHAQVKEAEIAAQQKTSRLVEHPTIQGSK